MESAHHIDLGKRALCFPGMVPENVHLLGGWLNLSQGFAVISNCEFIWIFHDSILYSNRRNVKSFDKVLLRGNLNN